MFDSSDPRLNSPSPRRRKSDFANNDNYEGVEFGESKERAINLEHGIEQIDPVEISDHDLDSADMPRQQRDPAPGLGVMLGKIMWLSAASMMVCGIWYVGPRIVEEYHYAAARGKTRAQYDVAKVALKDAPLTNLSTAFEFVASRIRPSVVHIEITTASPQQDIQKIPGIEYNMRGQGSGVIMDERGFILTNYHVIEGQTSIDVTLFDRRIYPATVVGADPDTDLAIIKINAGEPLIAAEWGDSNDLTFGTLVWSVGSPFGLAQSVTHGIVSANHRPVGKRFQDLIQTDVQINPGNSGGPLVNAQGEVIGINTSIVGKRFRGVSFSISSRVAKNIYEQLMDKGRVARGYFGVYPAELTEDLAKTSKTANLEGAYINQVKPNSPADLGGIKRGDVVVEWNGSKIDSEHALYREVALTKVNSTVDLKVVRQGESISLSVTVVSRDRNALR